MNLIEKINLISEEAKNKFKPDLIKYGKNFRAISESAVLDVLSPLLKKYNLAYNVEIKSSELHLETIKAGSDNNGNAIEQLLFVANCVVELRVGNGDFEFGPQFEKPINIPFITFEGWGSGVDYGDKATGKAITAAVKYALFKGFRLQYSDDPDAEESKPIEIVQDVAPENAADLPEKDEILATPKMLGFIKGLCVELKINDRDFYDRFGFPPFLDARVPMKKARQAIDELKKERENLPF